MSKRVNTGHGLNAAQKERNCDELRKPFPNGHKPWYPKRAWAKKMFNRALRQVPIETITFEFSEISSATDVPSRAFHIWQNGNRMKFVS
jgi:hypothetical protein